MQTIGVCGLGYTGSGAVIDFLAEFKSINVCVNPEFSVVYTPDGLEDLEYHLMKAPSRYMASDIAIKRFISYVHGRNNRGSGIRIATNNQYYKLSIDYIKSLIQLSWKGYWGFDFVTAGCLKRNIIFRLLNSRITPAVGKLMKRNLDFPPVRDMYLSITPDDFYKESKKYIKKLIHAMSLDGKEVIVLNQPFAADHPTKSFPYFENPFAIVVDRDPRDLYILLKRVVLDAGRFIPVENVKDFVKYYEIMHETQEDVSDRDDVIRLRFEDLIYEYTRTSEKLIKMLRLESNAHEQRYFNPDVSINNTQLFLKYPEFKEDIEYIETELKDWLYPFEKYDRKPNWRSEAF